MKKFFIVLLSLALSVGLYGQEITGKWIQTHRESENGSEIATSETLSLEAGDTFEQVMLLEMKFADGKDGQAPANLKVRISCSGTWALADNVLSQKYNAKSVKTEVLEMPEGCPKFLVSLLSKEVASEFKKHSKKPILYNVISLTSDTLQIQEVGEKDPELETYTRLE